MCEGGCLNNFFAFGDLTSSVDKLVAGGGGVLMIYANNDQIIIIISFHSAPPQTA